jgi:hypothetical protein
MIRSIEKKSGTYADSLEAVGWSTLMAELGVRGVEIRDEGWRFVITGEGDIPANALPKLGFWFISDSKNPAPRSADWALDYDAERKKEEARREFEKATKKKKGVARAAEGGDLVAPDPPKPELKLAKMIASMRKGWNADRDLAAWIGGNPEPTRRWLAAAVAGEEFSEAPELSNTQFLNPGTGKGVTAAKTQAKSAGAIPAQLVDSFAEWMKLRGMWEAMLAYRSGDDLKFMVLEPGCISPSGLATVHSRLEALNLWGGVRLDIDATLRCTLELIQHSDVVSGGERISIRGKSPRMVISGLRQAYFKSLGTAAALMNDALLPLPEWFAVRDRDDADAYFRIIVEAIGEKARGGCLAALDEIKSDEGAVLQQYRSWLASGDFDELMDFHHQFGALMLRKAAAGDYSRTFQAELLDELLIRTYEGTHMLKEIIQDEGFQSIARAIRNTTIYAVGMKHSDRTVNFGLAQRWKQKMKQGPEEFSAELADFVQANNWEVVYRLEGRGHQVATAHLDSVFDLIEKHGETKVGALLLAYGFSRAPSVKGDTSGAADPGIQGEGASNV